MLRPEMLRHGFLFMNHSLVFRRPRKKIIGEKAMMLHGSLRYRGRSFGKIGPQDDSVWGYASGVDYPICPDSQMNYNFPMQFRHRLLLLGVVTTSLCCISGAQETQSKQKKPQPQVSDPIPHSDEDQETAPPLGENESSSKQTQIDISPPKDDAAKHPDSEVSDITEMHPWNPHKAQKDIEVGEFYFKRKNCHAAEERYREALLYKPGDAIATYRLAEVLDAQGQTAEAVKNYEQYLKIPSNGKFAPDAKKALARLEAKTSQAAPQ